MPVRPHKVWFLDRLRQVEGAGVAVSTTWMVLLAHLPQKASGLFQSRVTGRISGTLGRPVMLRGRLPEHCVLVLLHSMRTDQVAHADQDRRPLHSSMRLCTNLLRQPRCLMTLHKLQGKHLLSFPNFHTVINPQPKHHKASRHILLHTRPSHHTHIHLKTKCPPQTL